MRSFFRSYEDREISGDESQVTASFFLFFLAASNRQVFVKGDRTGANRFSPAFLDLMFFHIPGKG
jgi:hypothetical protein